MRYKLLDDGLPVSTTTSTVIPFDPMTLVVAAALMNIDRKLDAYNGPLVRYCQVLSAN